MARKQRWRESRDGAEVAAATASTLIKAAAAAVLVRAAVAVATLVEAAAAAAAAAGKGPTAAAAAAALIQGSRASVMYGMYGWSNRRHVSSTYTSTRRERCAACVANKNRQPCMVIARRHHHQSART
eukprot:2928219-Pleurochrysis_carterae.AAC.1